MTNKSYIPILAVFGAIMLVAMAAIAPSQSFLGPDFVYAQARDDATLESPGDWFGSVARILGRPADVFREGFKFNRQSNRHSVAKQFWRTCYVQPV